MINDKLRSIKTSFKNKEIDLIETNNPNKGIIIIENKHESFELENKQFNFLKSKEFKRIYKILKQLQNQEINILGLEGYCEENLDLLRAQQDLIHFLLKKPKFKHQIGLEREEPFKRTAHIKVKLHLIPAIFLKKTILKEKPNYFEDLKKTYLSFFDNSEKLYEEYIKQITEEYSNINPQSYKEIKEIENKILAEEFLPIAIHERNQFVVNKINKRMKDEKEQLAIIVIGSSHTESLISLFQNQDKNISFLIFRL